LKLPVISTRVPLSAKIKNYEKLQNKFFLNFKIIATVFTV